MNNTSKEARLKILLDIPALINSSLEFGEIRKSTIEAAARLAGAETASLLFLDEETGELYFDVILVKGESIKNSRIGKGQGIAGWVALHREPLIIDDVQNDPRFFKELDKKSKFKSRNMICLPVVFKGRVLGVLEVINKKAGRFNADDLDMLTVLSNQVAIAVENAHLYAALREQNAATCEENRELKDYLSSRYSFQEIITISPVMREALKLAEKVAKKPFATVAIFGENGTGKEVLARAIHNSSGLLENRFVAVNCAAIPQNLLESELFGHLKGAFTGADRDRDGKFDAAQKGTLLLDEIGDMPLDLQVKLLRVLQERCWQKVGSNQTIKAELRVIATTHRDLKAMVRDGWFREDLYHRLCMFPIIIPPLRERREDIPLLVEHFMEQFQKELGKQLPGVSRSAMNAMLDYRWPGNVRELKNCLERATILTDSEPITSRHLGIPSHSEARATGDNINFHIDIPPDQFSLDAAVNQILEKTLERCEGNKTRAAEFLKVNRKIFIRRIA